jgi:hypothetical protein
MPLILGTNSIKDTSYDVANSLRFNSGSSDYLNHETGNSTTSSTKTTLSAWVKRSSIGNNDVIFGHEESNSLRSAIYINDDDDFLYFKNGSNIFLTDRKFRDTSAWYHFVVTSDLTQATASNRVKLYVNGVQETSFSTENYPSQNASNAVPNFGNQTIGVNIFNSSPSSNNYFDGYMAEVVFIDGQALDPTSFGEFDSDSPTIWKPKNVSGLTFGTHGFYLDFENASSLGADVSGNSNNFTVNNLTSVDQSTDTCTNNFSTFNPLIPNTTIIYQEGNLKVNQASNSDYTTAWSTIAVSQGKWYAEFKAVSGFDNIAKAIGFLDVDSAYDNDGHIEAYSNGGAYGANGRVVQNGSGATSYTTYTNGDIIGIALDLDNGKVYYHKNGTYINSGVPTSGSTGTGAFTVNTGKSYIFSAVIINFGGSNIWEANFGSPSFAISSGNADGNGYGNFEYAVPSSYYSLCTKNLAEYG